MTDAEFYNHVIADFYIIGHSISLFLGFIFGFNFWKELLK